MLNFWLEVTQVVMEKTKAAPLAVFSITKEQFA